jgi:hypothetical protein
MVLVVGSLAALACNHQESHDSMTPSSTSLASIAVLPNRQYEHRQVHVLPSRAHVLCYQHPVLARRTVSASRQSPQRPSYRVSVLESLSSHVQPCIRNDHVERTIAKFIVNAGQSETVNKQCTECSSRAERPEPELYLPTLLPPRPSKFDASCTLTVGWHYGSLSPPALCPVNNSASPPSLTRKMSSCRTPNLPSR